MGALKVFLLIVCTLSLVATAVFSFMIWSAMDVTATMPSDDEEYTLEALAVNITILEIVIAMVGFALAVVGLFGYKGIKDAAVSRAETVAETEARQIVSEQIAKLEAARGNTDSGPQEHPGKYSAGSEPTDGAVPAGDE